MEMYWVLLFAPSFFSAVGLRRLGEIKIVFLALFLLFAIVVGLRDDVGMDWGNYLAIYDSFASGAATFTFEELSREPVFYFVNALAYESALGITFVNLVHALVFLGGLFYFAYKKCPDRFLAIAVATPYLVIVVGMSGIRQAAAIGVVLYLLAVWDRIGTFGKTILLIVAAGFHTSAILLTSLILIDRKTNPIRVFLVAVVAIAVGLLVIAPSQDYYVASYVDENLKSEGAIYHALLVVGPAAAYLAFKKQFVRAGLYEPLLFKMAILALAMFPLLAVSSTGVDRFLLYFTAVQMYVLSALPRVFNARAIRPLMILVNGGILWTWLEYANNARAWRIYTSCLTSVLGCFN